MNSALLMVFPIAFPLFAGTALLVFPIRSQRRRHVYAASVPIVNALLLFAALLWGGDGSLTLWRVTDSLTLTFRMDALAAIFAVLEIGRAHV